MDRRKFIRLAGGGTAAAALAGCTPDLPAAAIAAWQGPAADLEPRLWALSHAILAPSSHNRQPWLVDLREADTITLYVDRERLLPETDPWYRQIMVSQGTFLEILLLALRERGLAPELELFPQGEPGDRQLDDRPVARVRLARDVAPEARDPLFAHVLRRHTAKVAFAPDQQVDEALLARVATGSWDGRPTNITAGFTTAGGLVGQLRQLAIDAARVEVGTARTVMESNRLTRIGPNEIETHRDGITLNDWTPRLAAALGLFDRSQAPAPGSTAFDQMMKVYEQQAQSAGAFLWITTTAEPGAGRSAEVHAGRLFVRQQLLATAWGLQVHPMSQAPQEFAEMQPHRHRLHQLIAGSSNGRSGVIQMLCRVGYCDPQAPTPRRMLQSMIRA